jgi:nucleoside-diphosphate-sugar epimerase
VIVVTGATGFVGSAVCAALAAAARPMRAISRNPKTGFTTVGALTRTTNWFEILEGVETVIHLAARVHMRDENAPDPLMEFRKTNVEGTLHFDLTDIVDQRARDYCIAAVRSRSRISGADVCGAGGR